MKTSTKPIPMFSSSDAAPTNGRLRGLLSCNSDTLPIAFGDVPGPGQSHESFPTGSIYLLQAATVAALVALRQAIADDEISRPLDLTDLKLLALSHVRGRFAMHFPQDTTSPAVAITPEEDGEETAELPWSKRRSKIRAAARAYSEQTHADY